MTIHLRAATRADAADIAALMNMAGEGLPMSLWQRQAGYGEDPMQVGVRDAAAGRGIFFDRAAIRIAEVDGEVAGLLISSVIGSEPRMLQIDTHPVMRPILKLTNRAPAARLVQALAVYPQHRRRGIASRLMEEAEAAAGLGGLVKIVGDANELGRGFLDDRGYALSERAPMIRADWDTANSAWMLMQRHDPASPAFA